MKRQSCTGLAAQASSRIGSLPKTDFGVTGECCGCSILRLHMREVRQCQDVKTRRKRSDDNIALRGRPD